MGKIKAVGGGFIKIGAILYNLKAFSKIIPDKFGIDEKKDNVYGIIVYPLTPSKEDIENGVDGEFFLTTYTKEEADAFSSDFETITEALKTIV